MRLWLHERKGNESGWSAWSLDYLGFATWASSRDETFEDDLRPAQPDEVARCLALLQFPRQDLLTTVSDLPDAVLDWTPTYQQCAEWAWWQTIRQIVKHVAMTEVGYYLPKIGYTGPGPAALAEAGW